MADRQVLYAAAFLRALGIGMLGVLLGLYLARLNFTPATVGYIVGSGLLGGALGALLATLFADRHGRRAMLIELAALGGLGAAVAALGSGPWVIGAGAFIGMLNGMGRDRGAQLIIEQAILPATVSAAGRTRAIAVYTMLIDLAQALGGLLAGLPALLAHGGVADELSGYRGGLWLYAGLMACCALLYGRLSRGIEVQRQPVRAALRSLMPRLIPLTPASRGILLRLCALFALDSVGGGFLTTSLLSYFFFERFHVGGGAIAVLFCCARGLNALSHLGAAWLAARIGLVKTMVLTHVPSSLLLITVAWVPSFPVAAALFLLREGLVEMDVPTRTSYVMAVVEPSERTTATGVTSLVRLGGWAVAPLLAGPLMQGLALGAALVIGASLKLAYDVALYVSFRHLRPPEERDGAAGG